MFRFKPEKGEYYVLPGGTVEDQETLIDALKREIKEETNLDIEDFEKVTEFKNDSGKIQLYHVYRIKKYNGTPKIIGEELDQNSAENKYELQWKELRELHDLPLVPYNLVEMIF